jgi:hypothetical protein
MRINTLAATLSKTNRVTYVRSNVRNDLKMKEKGNQIQIYVVGFNLLHENRKHRQDKQKNLLEDN